MHTQPKNKNRYPGLPDMTPAQRSSAGLPGPHATTKGKGKKLTKNQKIAALEMELQAAKEKLQQVMYLQPLYHTCLALTIPWQNDPVLRSSMPDGD